MFSILFQKSTILAPMKILCFILSLYVFFLSTVSCCLDDNCNDEIETEYANNVQQDHDHEEENCNSCSPFLTCGTCSGFFTTSLKIVLDEIIFIEGKVEVDYIPKFSEDFNGKIWQPPKIS